MSLIVFEPMDVAAPLIVAALANRNDTVIAIDTVDAPESVSASAPE